MNRDRSSNHLCDRSTVGDHLHVVEVAPDVQVHAPPAEARGVLDQDAQPEKWVPRKCSEASSRANSGEIICCKVAIA